MANPVTVTCPKDTWQKVATNVTSATVGITNRGSGAIYQTYVMTGTAAPSGLDQAVPIVGVSYSFVNSLGSDIYIYSQNKASVIRADL